MLDISTIRSRFPALSRTLDGRPVIYADGPGGTQVPQSVIAAMADFLARGGSNLGGPFVTSEETDAAVHAARAAIADLFNAARPEEISFGQNMTSITLSLGRALAHTWEPGDEILCTRLDHDANVSSWMAAASEAGAIVKLVDFDPKNGTLHPQRVAEAMTPRTRLVAVTHASNAIGTVVDVAAISKIAHDFGALVFVDAVHYTPHRAVDVQALECDFLAASAYKFFGPHTGALYSRLELSAHLDAVKIRPAPEEPPGKWESGTQSFESLAGVAAAVDYIADLGEGSSRRERVVAAMGQIVEHERALSAAFLDRVGEVAGVRVYGLPTPNDRTPTFALSVDGLTPREVATELGRQGIFVWHGHYYALEVMRQLGVLKSGGLVRIGFVHYNTMQEVDATVAALAELAS
jgi:cysteine desulfurase family protein (TIGR01976 family)